MAKEYFETKVLPKVLRLVETQTQQFLSSEDLKNCSDLIESTKSNTTIICGDYCVTLNKSYMITCIQYKRKLQFPLH